MASLATTIREPCPFQIPDQLPNLRRHSVVSRPDPLWGHIVEIGAPAGCTGTRLPRGPSVTGSRAGRPLTGTVENKWIGHLRRRLPEVLYTRTTDPVARCERSRPGWAGRSVARREQAPARTPMTLPRRSEAGAVAVPDLDKVQENGLRLR